MYVRTFPAICILIFVDNDDGKSPYYSVIRRLVLTVASYFLTVRMKCTYVLY